MKTTLFRCFNRKFSCTPNEENLKNIEKVNLEQEKLREYYIKNKERIQEKKKQYRLNNSEKIKEKNREYNLKNKDAIKEKNREYYLQHRESLQQKKKEYRRKNKVKIKQKNQEYLIKNKESMKDKWRAYYLENKETIKERKKEYRTKKKMNENALSRKRFSWKDSASTRKYFETTATFFHITDYSDWYRVSRSQINLTGGNGLIRKFGNLGNALKYAYPEIPWDLSKFSFRGKKSAQRWLFVKMKQLLPNMKIMEEFSHPDLVWENVNQKHVRFDVWVPEHNLALEYQGEHHYYDKHRAFGPGSKTQLFYERDQEKKEICLRNGISLVCIPYWWDGNAESLSTTLNQILPHVFPKTQSPAIPLNPPKNFSDISIEKENTENIC